MKKYVLIVAGGSGKRMNAEEPKQFIPISGKPVLMHTISRFTSFDPSVSIILVLPPIYHGHWDRLCSVHGFNTPYALVAGGEKRFDSVQNGLSVIQDEGVVFIHDGVRPFVSPETIRRCYETALSKGNAIPVVPVTESVRRIGRKGNSPVSREKYVLIQTPQTFMVSLIQQAYRQEYLPGFTDDASVLEKTGVTINLVEGNRENIKITWPEDLLVAEALSGKIL